MFVVVYYIMKALFSSNWGYNGNPYTQEMFVTLVFIISYALYRKTFPKI